MRFFEKAPDGLPRLTWDSLINQRFISRQFLFCSLSAALTVVSLVLMGRIAERTLIGRRLVVAAGNETGGSYRFSRAFKAVVEANSSLRVDVCATDGTDDNIRALERTPLVEPALCTSGGSTQRLRADLITAQADRLYDSLTTRNSDSTPTTQESPAEPGPWLPPATSARAIAVLYQDHFQLLVNPARYRGAIDAATFDIPRLQGRTIGTPQAGGQRPSLKTLSDHFGFSHDNLDLNLSRQDGSNPCQEVQSLDAIFRVRRLGNSEIRQLVDCGWLPVAIPQAQALQTTQYPAYNPATIPQGSYQGSPPIPATDLGTIAVDRLFVAHRRLPGWVVETLADVLYEHQHDLRQAIIELSAPNELNFDPEVVIPLVSNITEPTADNILPVHRGAAAFYSPLQLPFVVENADFAALLISIGVLAYSAYIQLKNLRANTEIKALIDLIKPPDIELDTENALTSGPAVDVTPDTLIRELEAVFEQHRQLDEDFKRVSSLLDHEGFRAYSEAYKSAREMLERKIEDRQRSLSSLYVDQVIDFLELIQQPSTNAVDLDELSETLDTTFINAANQLTKKDIFSRESFRTFSEAYEIARETLERKKRGKGSTSGPPAGEADIAV